MDVWILVRSDANEVDVFEDVVGVFATLERAKSYASTDSPSPLSPWSQDGAAWMAECVDPESLYGDSVQYFVQAFAVLR